MVDWPRYLMTAVFTYGIASYGSYRYSLMTKAQEDLRDIKDHQAFLRERHDKISETYDSDASRTEFSNKYGKFRKTLLSYAQGRVLEMGIGTGANLAYYDGPKITELIGVDWSEHMLMKAFGKLDDIKQAEKEHEALQRAGVDISKETKHLGLLPEKVSLVRADCINLEGHYEDESFDTIVDTLTLHSVYNREQLANEMRRLCKPGGHILLLERGQSYLSIFNMWLQFRAAKDLIERGTVEHLDIEQVVNDNFGDLKIIHKERKNMGMTYVYIIQNSPADPPVEADEANSSP